MPPYINSDVKIGKNNRYESEFQTFGCKSMDTSREGGANPTAVANSGFFESFKPADLNEETVDEDFNLYMPIYTNENHHLSPMNNPSPIKQLIMDPQRAETSPVQKHRRPSSAQSPLKDRFSHDEMGGNHMSIHNLLDDDQDFKFTNNRGS